MGHGWLCAPDCSSTSVVSFIPGGGRLSSIQTSSSVWWSDSDLQASPAGSPGWWSCLMEAVFLFFLLSFLSHCEWAHGWVRADYWAAASSIFRARSCSDALCWARLISSAIWCQRASISALRLLSRSLSSITWSAWAFISLSSRHSRFSASCLAASWWSLNQYFVSALFCFYLSLSRL